MNKIIIIIMLSSILSWFGCKNIQKNDIEDFPTDAEIEASVQTFLNRPIYSSLTREIIDKTEDHELIQTVFDNISTLMEHIEGEESEILKTFTKGQRAIYSIWIVEAEVNNGGLNQLYFNGNEKLAIISEEGFKTINAPGFSELMVRANKLYNQIKPELEKFNDGTVESFSESYENNPLDKLDEEFFKLYKREDLSELNVIYIRENISEFEN